MTTKFRHAGLDWHPHTPGDLMPCLGDTRVRVLARGEHDEIDEYVDFHYTANHWVWGKRENPSLDIIGWHPIEEQPDPAETHRRATDWHSLTDADLRLRLGELTAQEIRTVRAVLNAILAEETTN